MALKNNAIVKCVCVCISVHEYNNLPSYRGNQATLQEIQWDGRIFIILETSPFFKNY